MRIEHVDLDQLIPRLGMSEVNIRALKSVPLPPCDVIWIEVWQYLIMSKKGLT